MTIKKRKYWHDYLNKWRDGLTRKYIWIQVNYSTTSFEPYHLVAELNKDRNGHIIWPLESPFGALPVDNLDFRSELLSLPSRPDIGSLLWGSEQDYATLAGAEEAMI